MVKAEFAIFQGVPIFKSSPPPNAPTDFLQTIRFGKLKVHGFQKYMSAKVPGGGRVSISGPRPKWRHVAARKYGCQIDGLHK